MCEEFGCLPGAAERELDERFDLVMDVLFARNYARAKAAYDHQSGLNADQQRALLADPIVQLVQQTEFELAQEEIEGRHG